MNAAENSAANFPANPAPLLSDHGQDGVPAPPPPARTPGLPRKNWTTRAKTRATTTRPTSARSREKTLGRACPSSTSTTIRTGRRGPAMIPSHCSPRRPADAHGLSRVTVRRAFRELGGEAVRIGFGPLGEWYWRLPGVGVQEPQPTLDDLWKN